MALLFIEASPDLDLVAVTTIFGNSDIETTTRNALYLKQRFGLTAPVYKGTDKPLVRPRNPSPTFVHGENASAANGEIGGFRISGIERGDAAVVENQVSFEGGFGGHDFGSVRDERD